MDLEAIIIAGREEALILQIFLVEYKAWLHVVQWERKEGYPEPISHVVVCPK